MRIHSFLSMTIALLLIAGCSDPYADWNSGTMPDFEDEGKSETDNEDATGTGQDTDAEITDDNEADDLPDSSDFTTSISIVWSSSGATVTGNGTIPLTNKSGHVTLGDSDTDVKGLTITLSGESSDGSFKYYNASKTCIVLDGVKLTSKTGPAINIQCKKKSYIIPSAGTTSTLVDAATYSDVPDGEDAKGCLFSEGQMIFIGGGTLKVTGNAKSAIVSDDYIRLSNGKVNVLSAASDGLKANDYIRIDSLATVEIDATGDGIQSVEGYIHIVDGSVNVTSVDRAMDAATYVCIEGGTSELVTSGQSAAAVKSGSDILISGGTLTATVSGQGAKALKSDNNITISGGTLTLTTSGAAYYDSEDKSNSTPACIKAENIVTLKGGNITCKSTGKAGKGVNCYKFACQDGAILGVTTTGGKFSSSGDISYAKGIRATGGIDIDGGSISVKTSGAGAEGIESKSYVTVDGGQTIVNAYDDAINAAGQITINGGFVYAYGSSNDGIDSNYGRSGALTINGGVVIAHSKTSPEEGIDCDNHSYLVVKGGVLFSSGGQQASSGSPTCSQSCCYIGGSVSVGWFTVTDANGAVIMSCYVPRTMTQNYSYVSSPDLKSGTTYYYGVTSSKPTNPTTSVETLYYAGGTSTKPSSSFSATGSYQAINVSSGGGMGGGGGQGGGGGHGPGGW